MNTYDRLVRIRDRADRIAERMFGDPDDPLHKYFSYLSYKNEYLIVKLGIGDPERKGMFCWVVMGEIHPAKYFVRFPLDECPYWKDGVFNNGVREFPCPQNIEGMLETMDNYRKEFLRTGYIKILNGLNMNAIENLPG